ncbi:MAG: VWA domain-containing protein, partial [Gemmatimonadaceae bacterium]|nr:VWA domain-containing protein [Gemmatimonadaceae bacterium]
SVDWNREQYDRILDNPFLAVRGNPRSTFSVDVDRSSYGNVRRFLMQGQLPPADAVRIEEMVNYFPYNLEAPRGDTPVVITTEAMAAPWQPKHQLVRIALQARRIDIGKLPPSNLVFLIDVSGSMNSPDKLPLVKESLRLLVEQLREQDRVAIVVYAGAAGLVLPSTSGDEKSRIMEAIDRLEAGGSTAGGAGLELAYKTAREHFERGGNNRVILATDGDFNVGPSSDAAMERLIESKRAEGTYLTILGYGTGNYQDAKIQKLARVGNGNAAYVDDIAEAKKVLVKEMGGTLVTVANDVKLQVEFNPARVASYRLIGYEDRILRDEDFRDDKKDAGDMGAGHSVTALYEVVPVGVRGTVKARESDPLRYAVEPGDGTTRAAEGDELLHVSLRYKKPGESSSRLITKALRSRDLQERVSDDLRFAASVASFGMLLRDSEYKGTATAGSVLTLARGAMGEDDDGYRAEFVQLVERWRGMARGVADRPVRRDR